MLGLTPPVLLVAFLLTPAYIPVATAALFMGVAGSIMGSIPRAALAALLAPLPLLGSLLGVDPRFVACCMALMAGYEATRYGGRSFSMALIAAVMLVRGQNLGATPDTAILTFAIGVFWGLGLVKWLRFESRATAPATSVRGGVGHAAFLILGLLVSLALVERSDEPFAYWIVMMFLFRAMAPADQLHIRTWKFAVGAIVGAGCVLLVEAFVTLGFWPRLLVAITAATLGLRNVTMASSLPAMLFTIGVLMIGAPTSEAASFRIEAVLIVAVLVFGLSELLRFVLSRRQQK